MSYTGSRKHAAFQPARVPLLPVAPEGQVSKGSSNQFDCLTAITGPPQPASKLLNYLMRAATIPVRLGMSGCGRCVSVTQSKQMLAAVFAGLLAAPWLTGNPVEDLRVDADHPRILLTQRRLRLLKREKERDSMRWQQFSALVTGGVRLPEPGFSQALYFQVAGDEEKGRSAVAWALSEEAKDLRQLALVFDWCQPVLKPEERSALVAKIRAALERPAPADSLPALRDAALAAIALSGHVERIPEQRLDEIINRWWFSEAAPALESGRLRFPRPDFYALYEALHALRDNLNVDLRESAKSYFKDVPAYHLLSHSPAPFDAGENEFRVPALSAGGEPDLTQAALSRAAELAMVAFDTNALESQFLQGWLIRDRFMMRGPFGAPYEFLWANPYQPGLSVYHMPLYLHDPKGGRLLVRSSWEDDARWLSIESGRIWLYESGKLKTVDPAQAGALDFGDVLILFPAHQRGVTISAGEHREKTVFWAGLQPFAKYRIRAAAAEPRLVAADAAGIVVTPVPPRSEQTLALALAPAEEEQP